jgi:hypothetical protein
MIGREPAIRLDKYQLLDAQARAVKTQLRFWTVELGSVEVPS